MIERLTQITVEDASQIIDLGKKFYGLTGLSGSFHGDTFITFWNGFLKNGQASTWVYRIDNQIVGTIGMTLTMSLMDGVVIADETFWFVDENHRGTAGVRLFFEAAQWAKQSGAKRMLMGKMLAINPDNDSVGRFYERQGLKPLQTQYYLDL